MLDDGPSSHGRNLKSVGRSAFLGSWGAYVWGTIGVAAAFAARAVLVRVVGELPAYVIFYPVVLLIAFAGGVGPGLLASALVGLIAGIWVLAPRGQFAIASRADVLGLLIFQFSCVLVSLGGGVFRRARHRQRMAELSKREIEHDFAAQKAADDSLRESEQHFRLSIEAGSLGTWVHDVEKDLIRYDERSRGHFGVRADGPVAELIARIHPEDRERIAAVAAAWDPRGTGDRYAQEHRVIHPDGKLCWLRVEGRMTVETRGGIRTVVRTIGTSQDITPRRTADQALQASEQRLRLAYDAALAGAWEWDTRTDRTFWSDQTWRLYGLTPGECEPTKEVWRRTVHPDDLAEAERAVLDAAATGGEFATEWRTRDPATGEYRWLYSRGRPIRDDAGNVGLIAGIVMDITDRRRAEQALRDSEARLTTVIENLAEGLIIADRVGNLLHWNRAAMEMHEYTSPEQARRPLNDFIGEFELLPIEGSVPLDFEQWPMRRLIRGEVVRDMEIRLRRRDREWERIFSYGGTPVRDGDGDVQFLLLSITDVTVRTHAQISLRQAKEHAESASRAKDHFLAVVSHELRTPLTPVLAATYELQNRADLPADVREDLRMIRRNVDLQARLVDDLLSLTRLHRGKIVLHQEAVNVNAMLSAVVDQFQADVRGKGLELTITPALGEPFVWADPMRLQQSLANLVGNAVKFTPDGGRVSISASAAGDKIHIEVRDTGIGIEANMLDRLFNPFEQGEQTVTRKYGGLGLGLSIAKQFIELHGGTLTAASDGPGRGAHFKIELAAAPSGAKEAVLPNPMDIAPSQVDKGQNPEYRIWVLLVEDHLDTARMLARLLKLSGYGVETAGSVAEALAAAEGRKFDILLSDIGLPDGSGLDVARELRKRQPTIHAVALSGFGQPEDLRRSKDAGFADHLVKPLDLERLRNVLASVSAS